MEGSINEHNDSGNDENKVVGIVFCEQIREVIEQIVTEHNVCHTDYHPQFENDNNSRHIYARTHISFKEVFAYKRAVFVQTKGFSYPFQQNDAPFQITLIYYTTILSKSQSHAQKQLCKMQYIILL